MVFQESQNPWLVILGCFMCVIILVLIIVVVLVRMPKNALKIPVLGRIFLISVVCLFGCLFTGTILDRQQSDQNDASFSKQLMDEYHATSNLSFASIEYDSKQSGGAAAVFTRDGADTPVFVKLVKRDGETFALAFSALDEKSLYPKPSK